MVCGVKTSLDTKIVFPVPMRLKQMQTLVFNQIHNLIYKPIKVRSSLSAEANKAIKSSSTNTNLEFLRGLKLKLFEIVTQLKPAFSYPDYWPSYRTIEWAITIHPITNQNCSVGKLFH